MSSVYINPFTDFGFKKLFGEEANAEILIDFLNAIIDIPEETIVKIQFKDTTKRSWRADDRKAVYDIYCENQKGEQFIVELQKAKQKYFKDRTVFYLSYPIQEQAPQGEWNYELKKVYCIAILNFVLDKVEGKHKDLIHRVQLKDDYNDVFYDKMKLIYLEIPKFNKSETELTTRLDKWLYFFKNLEDISSMPRIFKDDSLFSKAFDTAQLANLNRDQLNEYRESLKQFRDMNNVIAYATQEGFDKAVEQYTSMLDEAQRREKEAQKREEEAQKREEEAQRQKQEAQRQKQEAQKREQDTKAKLIKMVQLMISNGSSIEKIATDLGISIGEIQKLLQ
jgi:predicted transposase/invertase (TIGR01784 family)